jgi:hypothetical protein
VLISSEKTEILAYLSGEMAPGSAVEFDQRILISITGIEILERLCGQSSRSGRHCISVPATFGACAPGYAKMDRSETSTINFNLS